MCWGGVVHAQQRRRMNIGVVGRDDDCRAASFTPPIEVVHAFGSCPDRVRDNVCALDDGRVVYVVGSRVAVKATAESSVSGASSASSSSRSSNDRLEFLSTGLRVARVTALTCSPEKGFVAVCYKGVVDGPNQGVAYATVYHMPTRPRPSRVKTLSYERPRRQQRQRGSSFSGSGSIEGTSRYDSSSTTSSSGGGIAPGGRKRRTHTPPPPSSTSATAEFVSATFSHDSRFLVVLDGSPEWTLVWFEWKTGKRMYTLQLDSPVHRVALSPLDHSKTATAGADGHFRIWRTQQGGKVTPMVPIAGLREDVCYRDVAWLNGDRLVLVAHEGTVTLVSPSDVLQDWNLGDSDEEDASHPCSPSSPIPIVGGSGGSTDSIGTEQTMSAGAYEGSLNVVAAHARGFFVGGSHGQVLVFEQEKNAGGGGGGGGSGGGGSSARDTYALTRVVRIFGVDLVELRPTAEPDYRWLLAGAEDGEIGLLDVNELLSAAPDGGSLASSVTSSDGGVGSTRRGGGATLTSGTTGVKSGESRTTISRLCRGRSTQAAAPESSATGAAADEVSLETCYADGGGIVSRGFAKAMDAFEDSLRVAADAELGLAGAGSRQQHAKKGNGAAATRTISVSGSKQSRETTIGSPLYRPVARGLGLRGRQEPIFSGDGDLKGAGRRGGSLSCLTVCARKPLLGAIAKGGPRRSAGVAAAEAGEGRYSEMDAASNGDICGGGDTADSGVPRGKGQQQRLQNQHQPARGVEVQIWNYRTKRLLVRHRFGGGSSTGGGGGADSLVGSVIPAAGDDQRGDGVMDADGKGGGAGGGDGDVLLPVAISLHPSGNSIAVAFPHYVNVFYIVGAGGEAVGDQGDGDCGGVDGVAGIAASKDSLAMSRQQMGVAEAVAASDMAPLASLRSDQREFLTKGMFSAPGEQDQVINCDPVSAVHYSPGGHMLAVVTGKMVQVLGVHSGPAGGRLGRVQTFSGHASDVSSFCWGADDRRCWTTADGYIFEWEVGAGMGALGIDGVRRGEYISKRAVFEGIVADPALDGGVVACCVVGGNGVGGRRGGGTNISGGSDDVGGALGGFDVGRSESRQGSGSQGAAPVPTEKGRSLTVSDRTTINNISINRNNHDGDGEGRDRISPEAPQVSSGSSGSGNKIAKKKTKNNSSDETRRARSRRKELLAAASVCATTGGTMAPVASLPRGSTAPAPRSGGRTMATSDADALRPGGEGDQRKSSIFVWPRKIEASSQEAGLEATVPFRLTCVRATAFEARFKGVHNVLLAGTREGMALAFDWGRLLRNSGGGGCSGDRGWGNVKKEENGGEKAAALAPSAQVCLHSRPITSLALTADGTHFFTAAGDGAVFMCKVQLEGRHIVNTDSCDAAPAVGKLTPKLTNGATEAPLLQKSKLKLEGPFAGKQASEAAAAPGGSCMALEACVEELLVLMDQEAVARLQAKAAAAYQQLTQAKHQARFELEKSKRDQQKELAAVKEAGKMDLSMVEVDVACLRQALVKGKKEREDLVRVSAEQRKREASVMNAMYEKKLALQAESYIQLKIAYEELTQAAADDADEMHAKAELAAREHENSKREDMKRVLEDHRVLSGYVDFVSTQFHKAIDDEQLGHDKQINVLRATEEIGEIEKKRVRENAKAEVMASKKELRTLSKRMEQQCTREVDSVLALAAEKEKSEQLEARVAVLEQEVRAKAQRLSEWENMTDKQKTAVSELEKLKKALTMQLMEQRSMLESKDAVVTKTKEKLDRHAKLQNEGVRQVASLQKEISAKARMLTAVQAEMSRLKASLQHREALLKATGTRVMSALDSATEKDHWLLVKQKVEAIVVPTLDRERLDGLDPDEAAMEQSRQRIKMQESLQKMRDALRQEHQNNEQQNLVRIAENLELTRELNLLRKKNTSLAAKVTRLGAKIKLDKEIRRKQQAARDHSHSAPEFPGALCGTGTRSFSSPLPRLCNLNTGEGGGGVAGTHRPYVGGGGGGGGGGVGVSFGDEEAAQQGQAAFETGGPSPMASPGAGVGVGVDIGVGFDAAGDAGVGDGVDAGVDVGVDADNFNGRSSTALGASAAAAAAPAPAGSRRAVTATAAGGAEQTQQRQPNQGPLSASLLAARHGHWARPETGENMATPAVLSAAPVPRRSSGRLRAGGGGNRTAGGVGRPKSNKLGRSGMRVLMPGEGARDYSSLLKGSGSVRGRELEARLATAEAEATRLARENHRIALEAERAIGAREADAERAVVALTTELQKLRAAAAASKARNVDMMRGARNGEAIPALVGGERNSDGFAGLPSHFTSRGSSVNEDMGSGSTVVAVRLPSPGNTVCYSDGLSLSAPTPFGVKDEDDDASSLLAK